MNDLCMILRNDHYVFKLLIMIILHSGFEQINRYLSIVYVVLIFMKRSPGTYVVSIHQLNMSGILRLVKCVSVQPKGLWMYTDTAWYRLEDWLL